MLESGTTDCAFRERAIDGRRPWVGRATLATEYTVRYLLWVPVYQMYGAKTVAIIDPVWWCSPTGDYVCGHEDWDIGVLTVMALVTVSAKYVMKFY